VCKCVLLLPGANPVAVKYIIAYHIKVDNSSCRVTFQDWHSRKRKTNWVHKLASSVGSKKRAQNGTSVSETHWNLAMCWDVTSCLAISEEPVTSVFRCLETSVPMYWFNPEGVTSAAPLHSLLSHRLICLVTDTKCTSYTTMCGVLCIADALYLPKCASMIEAVCLCVEAAP
jgi:hypothetical protein